MLRSFNLSLDLGLQTLNDLKLFILQLLTNLLNLLLPLLNHFLFKFFLFNFPLLFLLPLNIHFELEHLSSSPLCVLLIYFDLLLFLLLQQLSHFFNGFITLQFGELFFFVTGYQSKVYFFLRVLLQKVQFLLVLLFLDSELRLVLLLYLFYLFFVLTFELIKFFLMPLVLCIQP